jgi:hypothetical protein
MKATDAKIKRILQKEYSGAVIREGQKWYIGHGVFLECQETKEHLLELMDYCKKSVECAQQLKNVIDGELGQYRITDNLFGSVLDLSERLSIIEDYAAEYIRVCRHMRAPEDKLRSAYFDNDSSIPAETDEDELPF